METRTNDKLFTSVYKRKDMGLNLIWIGCIFLFNPLVGLIDILPDFLGLILIYNGLAKLCDLDPRLNIARKRFFVSLWVALGMLISMFLIIFISFDRLTNLTISFAGMILWTIFLITGFKNLFEGLSYMKLRFGGKELTDTSELDSIKSSTILFIILRSITTVLPDIVILILEDVSRTSLVDFNFDLIRTIITVLSVIVTFIFGLVWLIKVKNYFKELTDDSEFVSYLSNRYENEIACDTHLLNVRKIKYYSFFCILAFACTLCIPFDRIHFMPEFALSIVLFFAYRKASEYIEDKKGAYKYLLLYFVSSLVLYVLRIVYSMLYRYVGMPFSSSYVNPYLFWAIYVLLIGLTILTYYILIKVSKTIYEIRNTMIDNVVGIKNTDSKYRMELDNQRKKELKNKSKVAYIITFIYCIVSIVAMLLIPFVNVIIPFGLYWVYRLVMCIIVMIALYVIGSDINDEAEKMI